MKTTAIAAPVPGFPSCAPSQPLARAASGQPGPLGVHREPEEHKELIRRRTEQMYPLLVDEFEALLLRTHGFYTEEEKTTIGYGDFHEIVNGGLRPIDSIFRRTLALAEWQSNAIRRHMPHVQWVCSADEALAAYREHQKGLHAADS